MSYVQDIYRFIDSYAPFATAAPWDNPGLLVGDSTEEVRGIVVALDATVPVINEAASLGCNLVVTHHPVIFDGIKNVLAGTAVHTAVKNGISIICAHTNLDKALDGGVNTALAQALGLTDVEKLCSDDFGLRGRLAQAMSPAQFADHIEQAIGLRPRYNEAASMITTVGLCGGAGGDLVPIALGEGAPIDAFVTADVKHHEFIEAARQGIALYDAGHYATEATVLPTLAARLSQQFPHLRITLSKVYSGAVN